MEKLKMHSLYFTNQNITRLAELFPDCVTESWDDDGTVKRVLDSDPLEVGFRVLKVDTSNMKEVYYTLRAVLRDYGYATTV